MKPELKTAAKDFAIALAKLFIVTPLLWLYFAMIVMTLWGWFITPLGLPAIGLAHAFGIALVATLLTKTIPPTKFREEYNDDFSQFVIDRVFQYSVLGVFGTFAHLCM